MSSCVVNVSAPGWDCQGSGMLESLSKWIQEFKQILILVSFIIKVKLPNNCLRGKIAKQELIQVKAWHLMDLKPLPEPMIYLSIGTNMIKFYLKHNNFHSRKSIWKCQLWNVSHLVPGMEGEFNIVLDCYTVIAWWQIRTVSEVRNMTSNWLTSPLFDWLIYI